MRLGYRLDFDGEILPRLPRKVRHTILKAGSALYVRPGSLEDLKKIHFDPVYLPSRLSSNQRIFVAVLDDCFPPISAVLIEERGDYIYYHYSGNHPNFKHYQGNSYLLWWIAEVYKLKGFKYFDLGGSTIPNIEKFKRGFSTSTYPLKPKPRIKILLAKIRYQLKSFLNNVEVYV